MTTVSVNSLPAERLLAVGANSVGYSRKKILVPNVFTRGPNTITGVTITNAGSGYLTIPTVNFSGGGGTGTTGTAVMKALSAIIDSPQSGAGSYAPGDTITLAGGIGVKPVLTVDTTQVVSAELVFGGENGEEDGTFTVTGSTGRGDKFQASVQFLSGVITSINSITFGGNYDDNPSDLSNEPVFGHGVVGAIFAIKMGVLTTTVSTPGALTVLPTAPVNQNSTTGSGTGATFVLDYGVNSVNITTGGSDYSTPPTVTFSGGEGTGAAGVGIIGGTSDPLTVSLAFTKPFNASSYTINAIHNQPGLVSYDNKETTGADITITPPAGDSLIDGTMDVVIEFTS
jgi:hypothetical protein